MSLKSKLEAVIYAAEEPVTLGQLAALFAVDALEWKAWKLQQEAAAETAASAPAETLSLLDDGFGSLGLEQTPAFYAAEPGVEPLPPDPGEAAAAAEESGAGEAEPAASTAAASEPAGEPAADTEGELRRQARQRDREVRAILLELIQELIASCAVDERGVEIREIAGGYRMATKPECHDAVRMFIRSLKPAMKLSLPALETLAVIAYKQPVTAPEVNEIRGVESGATLGSLLSRKLIATAGRKPVIGRPILYKTTREFLLRFGLKDIAELPSMEEFEKMATIELDERQIEAENGMAPQLSSKYGSELDEELFEPAPELPPQTGQPPTEAATDAPPPAGQAETETPPQ
jgi:segregation and condensation protein B